MAPSSIPATRSTVSARRRTTTRFASVPDLNHIIQLPWEPKVAWMPADNHLQGQAYPLNTRVALKNVLAEAAELGFGFNLGIECEVFVLQEGRRRQARKCPIPTISSPSPATTLRGFLDNFTWLDKVATCINDLGWDLYSFDHEDANGQYEFDFRYADALTTCDRFIFFRYMAKHYAKEEGYRDDDAEALRRQDRQRRAFQYVALRP